jgi:hypothetical protein
MPLTACTYAAGTDMPLRRELTCLYPEQVNHCMFSPTEPLPHSLEDAYQQQTDTAKRAESFGLPLPCGFTGIRSQGS